MPYYLHEYVLKIVILLRDTLFVSNNYFRCKTRCILGTLAYVMVGIQSMHLGKDLGSVFHPPTWANITRWSNSRLIGDQHLHSHTPATWDSSLLFIQAPLAAPPCRLPPAHGTQRESQSQTASLLTREKTVGDAKAACRCYQTSFLWDKGSCPKKVASNSWMLLFMD